MDEGGNEKVGVPEMRSVQETVKFNAIKDLICTMRMYHLQNTDELDELTKRWEDYQDLEEFVIKNKNTKNFTLPENSSWAKVKTCYNVDTNTRYSVVMGGNDYGSLICLVKTDLSTSLDNGANNAEIFYYRKDFLSKDVSPTYSKYGEMLLDDGKISLDTIGHDASYPEKMDAFVKEVLGNFQRLSKK